MMSFNIDITIFMCKISVFSSNVTMIFYFKITIIISFITDPTFSRVLKIFITFLRHYKFFVKIFYNTNIFDNTANKIVNRIFA